jgi:glycosyltransferase involved in cell wall biosynthesis
MLAERPDLPPWRVELIGPVSVREGGGGEAYRDSLLARYQDRLKGRLSILPPIYDANTLAGHYGRMAIFCYPSLAVMGEGLSIAPMEAMAAGAVAVVSKLDCYRDLIRPGENGMQFDQSRPDAVAQLAGHLTVLLRDKALRERIAAQSQADVRKHDYAEAAGAMLTKFSQMTGLRRQP